MCSPDGLRGGLGEPEEANLAGVDQLGHRPHGLLDRHLGVHPVLVVEVDVIDAEALERGLAGPMHVLGAAVDGAVGVVGGVDAELGGELHLVAPAGDRAAHQALVGLRPVHVGGVEQGDAELEGPLDGRDPVLVLDRGVREGHAHATEADGRDLEALVSETASLYGDRVLLALVFPAVRSRPTASAAR